MSESAIQKAVGKLHGKETKEDKAYLYISQKSMRKMNKNIGTPTLTGRDDPCTSHNRTSLISNLKLSFDCLTLAKTFSLRHRRLE